MAGPPTTDAIQRTDAALNAAACLLLAAPTTRDVLGLTVAQQRILAAVHGTYAAACWALTRPGRLLGLFAAADVAYAGTVLRTLSTGRSRSFAATTATISLLLAAARIHRLLGEGRR